MKTDSPFVDLFTLCFNSCHAIFSPFPFALTSTASPLPHLKWNPLLTRTQSKARPQMVTYYVTMFIENSLLASVSMSALKSGGFWFYDITILVIWGGFVIGLLSMMLYYKFFHIRFVKQSLIEVNFEYLNAASNGNAGGSGSLVQHPCSSHVAYYSANSNSIRNRPSAAGCSSSIAAGLEQHQQQQLSGGQQWIQLSAREHPITDASSKIATPESLLIASSCSRPPVRSDDVRMGGAAVPTSSRTTAASSSSAAAATAAAAPPAGVFSCRLNPAFKRKKKKEREDSTCYPSHHPFWQN